MLKINKVIKYSNLQKVTVKNMNNMKCYKVYEIIITLLLFNNNNNIE